MNASNENRTEERNMPLAIKPAEKREYYPLTAAQQGMYLQYREGNVSYNAPVIVLLEGDLDISRFESLVKAVVKRHEAFRTSFILVDGIPMQRISQDVDFKMVYIEADKAQEQEVIRNLIQPFILEEAPLARACLVKTSETRHIFVFDMHHIICDGASINILLSEISAMYKGALLPENEIHYKDYAVWYDEMLKTEWMEKQKKYWEAKFTGKIPVLNLPADFPDWMNRPAKGADVKLVISKEMVADLKGLLKKYARKYNATLHTLMFSIYALLIAKYSGQEDIIIGAISAGRNHKGLQNVVGALINVLPIRIEINPQKTFAEFLGHVTNVVLEAYQNQDYPFDKIIENLSLIRKNKFNPLFDTMFVFHGIIETGEIDMDGANLKMTPYRSTDNYADFGLKTDVFTARSGELLFFLDYNAAMMEEERVLRLTEHLKNIAAEVVKDPEKQLSQINMLSSREEKQVLLDFNDTQRDYPKHTPLSRLFEEQVLKSPNSTALVFEGGHLTYKELNEGANKVAWFLKEKGLGPNSIIGVMVERSPEMIIGIMGILKAGAAYLPIDPEYPAERINYFLTNSKAPVILRRDGLRSEVNAIQSEFVSIDNILRDANLPIDNLNIEYEPDRLMYVLYTSGSTGKPKGVMVKAHAFVNLLHWFVEEFGLNHNDRNLLIAPVSFDLSQKNLYATLIKGGILCLYPPGAYNYHIMSEMIEKEKITVINCAPGAFYPLVDFNKETDFKKLETLRYVFLGGEPINLVKLKPWIKSVNYKGEIVNTYGPTECTDIATSYRIDNQSVDTLLSVPIGKPIDNVAVYILDSNMNTVPVGIDGELCIGGISLAQGYFNEPLMTEERFVPCAHLPCDKIYKTGDLARWLPDGNIEFRGRIDQQVKIRGCRIELEEIENVLLRHESIKDAVVIDRKDASESEYLCAYIVLENEPDSQALKEYLTEALPEYMIPSRFVQLEKLPLNPNGKVDREALPEPEISTMEDEYVSPANEMEYRLADIWQEVLKVEKLGAVDNFFRLGANSLKIIVGASKIHKEIGVQVPLAEIFKVPTIRNISNYILDQLEIENTENEALDLDSIEFNF